MSKFDQFKQKAWLDYLIAKTQTIELSDFVKWFELQQSLESSENSIKWYDFNKMTRQPSTNTVIKLDLLVPGSMAVFDNGHDTLPLISVLNGSMVDCERQLLEILAEFKLYKANMNLRAKCEALFNLVIAKKLIIDRSKDKEDELAGLVVGGYYSLEEIMAFDTNLVAKSFEVGYHTLMTTPFKNGKPLIYGEYKILHERVVLAVLALIHICLSSNDADSKLIAYYLIDGINEKAIEFYFGKEISEYIKEEF